MSDEMDLRAEIRRLPRPVLRRARARLVHIPQRQEDDPLCRVRGPARATSISTTRSSTARSSHQTTPADRSSISCSGGPGGQPTSRLSCYGSTVPICALYAQRAPAAAASRSAAGIARTFALSEGLSVEKRGRQLFGVIGQPRLRRVPMRAFGCSTGRRNYGRRGSERTDRDGKSG